MTIADDIRSNASTTFSAKWEVREGTTVPNPADIKLSNDAVHFKRATILYADLDGSTKLVETRSWMLAGEVYKTFLYATSRLIRRHGGAIVSYDGDRVMGIFISDTQCNDAVSCALEINYAIKQIVQPQMSKGWQTDLNIQHVVGIDTSEIRAARTGVRGDNDIVWIGNAANLAAKLTNYSADNPTWITKRVYDYLKDNQKLGPSGENIWKSWNWNAHNKDQIYSTPYWRTVS
jgi:class 3 adenylate cyclase